MCGSVKATAPYGEVSVTDSMGTCGVLGGGSIPPLRPLVSGLACVIWVAVNQTRHPFFKRIGTTMLIYLIHFKSNSTI